MNDYIINTKNIDELFKKIAANVIDKGEIELRASDSTSTRTVWFMSLDSDSEGFTGRPVVYGRTSHHSNAHISEQYIARIEQEENSLILYTDL